MTDVHDLIQVFADGEPVDPIELDRALATPAGRAHLIDLLVLRGFVGSPSIVPSATAARPTRIVARSIRWWSAAAAIAMVTALGGYIAGERTAPKPAALDQPAIMTASSTEPAPPTPTRVIRFKQGVDWTEHKGGH